AVMPLVLYYTETSPPTRSVDLVIHALGLTAEHKEVDLFSNEHLSPDFLKINPLHTIPAVDDNGFILWG
ncbi:glutathione S-transferase 2-like, partial [Homalodisca vitripennis]|uniref:glutathione S-transferase 2-like n=1 Tax=Homalodisca vitripennis TaxID=197043 RepID=UPI001EE9EFC6